MSKQFRHGAPLIARHHTNMAGRSPIPETSLNDGARTSPPPEGEPDPPGGPPPPSEKVVVKLADGKARNIKYISSTSYWFDGKPISAREFIERLFGDLSALIAGEDELRAKWSDPDLRERLLNVLADRGYDDARLADMRTLIDAPDSDLFDVLAM